VSAFELARVPVTQSRYERFDRERRADHPDRLVVNVSWWEAWLFTRWLGVPLSTEAEWEYACRAGGDTRFSSGATDAGLARVGWYDGNSGGKLHPVDELDANGFGLHDLHGNVFEWCQDRWPDDDSDAQAVHPRAYDPVSAGSRYRVYRGGGY